MARDDDRVAKRRKLHVERTEVGAEPALELSSEGLGPRQQWCRLGRLPMLAGQAD